MRNKLDSWRSSILFWLVASMMVSLFFSRVALSAAVMAFVAVSFFHKDIKGQMGRFVASPLLWGMSLLFFIPLLSGLWSEDKQQWLEILRIKLPLLFLPLAFAGYDTSYRFSLKQFEWLGYLFIVLITGGVCWSLFHYLSDPSAINESYLKAKAIVTPLANDRVRFSWLVSVGVLLSGWLAFEKRKENKALAISLCAAAVLLILFLHILAVRTGLLSFYIMVAGTAIWLIVKKINWQWGLGLIILSVALPVLAYKTVPTFQNRIKYILYDSGYFIAGNYWPSSNDATRFISIKAGWNIMNSHPVTGVGAGDVLAAAREWYKLYYYTMQEADKIYPSSEWMIYGSAAGWPGLLLFSVCMLMPFLARTNNKPVWWILNITAASSFVFDIGLEVQFGVFIYSFIILWCYQWLNAKKM